MRALLGVAVAVLMGIGAMAPAAPPLRPRRPEKEVLKLPEFPAEIELRVRRYPMADPCPARRLWGVLDVSLCDRGRSPIASPFEDDPPAR